MAGTLPHTQNGFAQTAAEQHFREQSEDDETATDNTTLKFDGRMATADEDDTGSDPYNRTGRFRRLVR
jgi:hypothetical protein